MLPKALKMTALVPTTPVLTFKPTVRFITGNQFMSFTLIQSKSQLLSFVISNCYFKLTLSHTINTFVQSARNGIKSNTDIRSQELSTAPYNVTMLSI